MADTSTVVGQTILVKGNLEGNEDLTVQGRIEGAINLTKTLIIEQSGTVKADVSVSNAIISGIMVGNLSASDSVEITDTGRMVGDIHAPRVIIVEGALFKGKVDMGDLEMPRPATQEKRSTPAYRPSSPIPSYRSDSRPSLSKPVPTRPSVVAAPKKTIPEPTPEPKKSLPQAEPTAELEKKGSLSKKKVFVKKRSH